MVSAGPNHLCDGGQSVRQELSVSTNIINLCWLWWRLLKRQHKCINTRQHKYITDHHHPLLPNHQCSFRILYWDPNLLHHHLV
jgi:hypothetical protein